MPTIPTYDSKRSFSPKTPGPLQTGAGEEFEGIKKVAGTVGDIAQSWQKANDVMDITEASLKYDAGTAAIQAEAALDPNYENSAKYKKDLEKVRVDSLSGIRNQELAAKTGIDFKYGNDIAMTKIDTQFKQKRLKVNRDVLKADIGLTVLKGFTADNENERQMARLKTAELIGINLDAGTINEYEAQLWIDEAEIKAANYDAVAKPEEFLKHDADYYNIPADEYHKAKVIASNTITTNKKIAEKQEDLAMIETEADLTLNLANKKIESMSATEKASTIANVNQLMLDKKVSSTYGQAYVDMITSPKSVNAKITEYAGLSEYAKAVFDAKDPEQKRKAVIDLMERNTQGKLTQDKIDVVLGVAYGKGDNVRDNWFQNVLGLWQSQEQKEYRATRKGKTGEEKKKMDSNRMAYDLFAGVLEGKTPEKAKEDAIKNEAIRSYPEESVYEEEKIIEKNGYKYKVLKDPTTGRTSFEEMK